MIVPWGSEGAPLRVCREEVRGLSEGAVWKDDAEALLVPPVRHRREALCVAQRHNAQQAALRVVAEAVELSAAHLQCDWGRARRARSGASPTVAVLCVQSEMAHPTARRKGSQQLPLHWRHRAHCVWAASRVACREVIACEG